MSRGSVHFSHFITELKIHHLHLLNLTVYLVNEVFFSLPTAVDLAGVVPLAF